MTTNDFLVKGVDETRQWLPPLAMVNPSGVTVFAVNSDGSLIATQGSGSPVTGITGAAGYIKATIGGVTSFIPYAQ